MPQFGVDPIRQLRQQIGVQIVGQQPSDVFESQPATGELERFVNRLVILQQLGGGLSLKLDAIEQRRTNVLVQRFDRRDEFGRTTVSCNTCWFRS